MCYVCLYCVLCVVCCVLRVVCCVLCVVCCVLCVVCVFILICFVINTIFKISDRPPIVVILQDFEFFEPQVCASAQVCVCVCVCVYVCMYVCVYYGKRKKKMQNREKCMCVFVAFSRTYFLDGFRITILITQTLSLSIVQFHTQSVSDLVLVISQYTQILPLMFVFGIASSVDVLARFGSGIIFC